MLELTAVQTLIALPPAGCIPAIGLASAVFTYYLVKLLVKPFITVRYEHNSYREFITTVLAIPISNPGQHPLARSNL